MTNENEISSEQNTLQVPEEVIGNGEEDFDIVDDDEEGLEYSLK